MKGYRGKPEAKFVVLLSAAKIPVVLGGGYPLVGVMTRALTFHLVESGRVVSIG